MTVDPERPEPALRADERRAERRRLRAVRRARRSQVLGDAKGRKNRAKGKERKKGKKRR